jgi:tetratricopeptide (TPR) repeat protein
MRSIFVAAALALVACAHTPPVKTPPKETRVEMEPMTFERTPSGELRTVDAQSLFDEAGAAFGDKRFADAVRLYDELQKRFPDSRLAVPALYNSGLALEGASDVAGAVERYKALLARGGPTQDLIDTQFRLAAAHATLKNWSAAAEVWSQVLRRSGPCKAGESCELTLTDRLEALARRAEAQLEMGDLIATERTLREQQETIRRWQGEERLERDFFVAMGAYLYGRVAHARYRALPLRLPEKRLADDLEQKGQMLLVAQRRYLDAMRVNNVEWATAAGYQIASLYRELYDDLLAAPVPPNLAGSDEARDIYREELKKQIKNLLYKAISTHEKNLLVAERTGVRNEWVEKSNAQIESLKGLLGLTPTSPPPSAPPLPTAPPTPSPPDRLRPTPERVPVL